MKEKIDIPAHHRCIFVSGIDTNIGKTYATAYLAKKYKEGGFSVITQKMIQTGCEKYSEDIEMHRKLTGWGDLQEDKELLTAPCVFTYPASPHLAAKIDKREIDLGTIKHATDKLLSKYEIVLLEGAGGLMVPIKEDPTKPLGGYLTIDYIKENNYPVVLVTSGRLGSINHTLLSIDACMSRGIKIEGIVYNSYPHTDKIIEEDTMQYLISLGYPLLVMEELA